MDQVTGRVGRIPPPESSRVTDSRAVSSYCRARLSGVTRTEATGTKAVTSTPPETLSTRAVTLALPVATARSNPVESTWTRVESLEAQTGVRSRRFPWTSLTMASNSTASPTSITPAGTMTSTLPTGSGNTVTLATPVTESAVKRTSAGPGSNPWASPVLSTRTWITSGVDHTGGVRGVTRRPSWSSVTAVKRTVSPSRNEAMEGMT